MQENNLDFYTSITPNLRQIRLQEMGFNVFIHYGMNTFIHKEWSDGTAPASTFNPTNQDTDQWVEAIAASGAKGVILTAKHHDGFCLWPTKTTEYSVKNSPYKDGNGDVVREVVDSCKKYNLEFGFYLSPWDRNSKLYGTDHYNDFFIAQLTELLTQYGDVFCVWLDGANASYLDGKGKQAYDFERIYETVYAHQPNCAVSNCGPDIRWVGNEAGQARKSEWNVVPRFSFDIQTIEDNSQQGDNQEFRKKGADIVAGDLGSRKMLEQHNDLIWYPAEVDVSIRPGWFYHKSEDSRVRSLNNLLNIYYNSVGGNSLLLLNLPPTTEGRLHENDVNRLYELGKELKVAFGTPVSFEKAASKPQAKADFPLTNVLNNERTAFSPSERADEYSMKFVFDTPATIDKVQLKELTEFSQRIETFEIWANANGKSSKVYDGTTVGYNRVALFKKPVYAESITLKITACRNEPYIRYVRAFEAGGIIPKKPLFSSIVSLTHKLNYMIFIARENSN